MKRSLIVLAFAGALATSAFATPTLTGDNTYEQVHLVSSKNAPEMTFYRPDSPAAEDSAQAQSNTYGQYGIYNFNP
jgi:hypothetical protein